VAEKVAMMKSYGFSSSNTSDEDLEKEIAEAEKKFQEEREAQLGKKVELPPIEDDAEEEVEEEEVVEEADETESEEDEEEPKQKKKNEQKHDWQKRHADSRRQNAELQKQLREIQNELKNVKLEANKKERLKNLSTEEDIEKFRAEYPDFTRVLDTMVEKRLAEVDEEFTNRTKDLDTVKAELHVAKVMSQVIKRHPDAEHVKNSEEFSDWIAEEAPENTVDTLSNPYATAKQLNAIITLFKADTGWKSPVDESDEEVLEEAPKKKRKTRQPPEDVPSKTATKTDPVSKREYLYSDSMVNAMSDAEFEQHMEQIDKARREGRYLYDATGHLNHAPTE